MHASIGLLVKKILYSKRKLKASSLVSSQLARQVIWTVNAPEAERLRNKQDINSRLFGSTPGTWPLP